MSSGLPTEWQQQAVRRLTYVGAIGVCAAVFSALVSLLRQENVGLREGIQRPLWPIFVALGFSACLLLVARERRLSERLRLDFGLITLVVVSFCAAYFRHSQPYAPSDVLRGMSAVGFCILLFAIIVPVSPWRMTIGASVAALTDPMALGLTIAQGLPNPPWNLWLWLFIPNVAAVVIAIFSAHLLYQVGRTVTEAREMGAYRLVELIGAGGMGEVWRAKHRTLARPAAIKLVRPEALGSGDARSRETILRRFEREAQATAMLTSPHTIDVFDFGISSDGSFYYVMELLDGMNLEELLRAAGPLPPARATHLLEQICRSLQDAHHAGMIHRDIKPANIFICRQGREWDYVKVLDFGLVKQLDAEDPGITVAGGIAGTPAYMAPEAARGGEVGTLTDLYALGCVGYRMLAGRDLFVGMKPMELIFAHAERSPEPLECLVAPEVPAALTALIMRCLEKDPGARPESAEAVLEALAQTGLAAQWTARDAEAWWTRPGDEERSAEPTVGPITAGGAVAAAAADTLPAGLAE